MEERVKELETIVKQFEERQQSDAKRIAELESQFSNLAKAMLNFNEIIANMNTVVDSTDEAVQALKEEINKKKQFSELKGRLLQQLASLELSEDSLLDIPLVPNEADSMWDFLLYQKPLIFPK